MATTSDNNNSFPGPSSMIISSTTSTSAAGAAGAAGATGITTTTTSTSSRSLAQLPRYDQCVPVLKSTHDQMKKCISIDLLTACQREVNFLRMIDRKAPVLYSDAIVQNAIRRYEQFWLPMQAAKPDLNNIPPLDIHWVWHCHMLSPTHYEEDCKLICGTVIDHKLLSSDEIQQRYEQSVSTWNNFCPEEPYDFLNSNAQLKPQLTPYKQKSSYDIAAAVQRQRNFNYQVSLPHFTAPKFLKDAIDRYVNFLMLKQTYHDQFLTPCYDFDLCWHTHQVHPLAYERDCTAIFGNILRHDDSVNDRSVNSKLMKGESVTKKCWTTHFKEGFFRRGCMYRGHVAPVFLGFENQDISNISYGHIHIPSISLKEIPVQREQLRLKLLYGSKKITTFNADLWDKQVTRSSFSLVWQPTEGNSSTSIVKFPFEKKNPKELIIELELYDKVFLQKRDVIKLQGRLMLEQLLPPPNSKSAQTITQMFLESPDRERDFKAKVNVTTSISLNRELELIAGEFIEQTLEPDSRLWTLCQSAALNRAALQPGATVYVATHTLIDVRDGAKFIAQIVHSAQMLLSMVLVYGTEQRLLCMSHLIGADSLPSKDQLDPNLQFLPHLSSPDERVFIVLNRDGDFAIIKGRWNGFSRKISGDKLHKGKSGSAGVLNVELFNLLRNTVQKMQLPGVDGSTLFVIGDAQARLNGRRMHCRSTQTAEHIASVFSIGTLFVLCNPDKVRTRQDSSPVGHQCQKWPMTMACGYGRPVPSNRYLSHGQDGAVDITPALFAVCGTYDFGDIGACGSCAACSACGSGAACGSSGAACGSCGAGCGGCGGCGG